MKICWGSHCLHRFKKPSLLNGIPLAYLKIYYYFKNNIVQSITWLVCVAKRLKLKILLPKSNWQKKNNINNTIITYLFSPVLCFVLCILLHSPFAWSLCTHFLAKKKGSSRRPTEKTRAATSETFSPFKIHRPVIVHETNYLFMPSFFCVFAPYQFFFVVLLLCIIYAKFVLIKVHRSRYNFALHFIMFFSVFVSYFANHQK